MYVCEFIGLFGVGAKGKIVAGKAKMTSSAVSSMGGCTTRKKRLTRGKCEK
jgi:hypothetical protein